MPGVRRLTDKGSGIGVVYSGRNQEELAYCQRCLEIANVHSKLGNRIFDNNTSCFFDMIEPFVHKMKIAFGKDDVNSPSVFREYADHFNIQSQYYSYDFGNIHFTVMSTEIPFRIGYPQYDFVRTDLERASKDNTIDWLVVYFHRPAYISSR